MQKDDAIKKRISRQPSITRVNSTQHSRKGSVVKNKPKKVREENTIAQILSPVSSSEDHIYMGGLDERMIESRIAENIRQT